MPEARITVADDDPSCRQLTCTLIGRDRQLHQAANGAELIQLLADSGPFDLVITDVCMPWLSGLQVLEMARGAGLRTPFLIVTGLCSADLPARVAKLQPAKLLYKPFKLAALREAVDALLSPGLADLGVDPHSSGR